MNYKVWLTTIDNPFDYFEQFTSWLMFDKEKGYNTCELVARIAQTSEDMTQKEEDVAIEIAIDQIIENDVFNIYKKITRETEMTQEED